MNHILVATTLFAVLMGSLAILTRYQRAEKINQFESWTDKNGGIAKPKVLQQMLYPSLSIRNLTISRIILEKFDSHIERIILPGMDHMSKSVLFADRKHHDRMKDLMMPFFKPSNIANMTETIEQILGNFLEAWDEEILLKSGVAVRDVSQDSESLILKLIGMLAFGINKGFDDLSLGVTMQTAWTNFNYQKNPSMFIKFGYDKVFGHTKTIKASASGILSSSSNGNDNFLPLISYLKKGGSDISDEEIHQNVMLLMFAAQETTRAVLESTLDYVSKMNESEAQSLAQRLGESNMACSKFVMDMIYKFPPVNELQRKVIKDISIDGYTIPAGTTLFLNIVDEFEAKSFSVGPRSCIGRKLAIKELEVIFKVLFTKYRFEKCEGVRNHGKSNYAKFIHVKGHEHSIVKVTNLIL